MKSRIPFNTTWLVLLAPFYSSSVSSHVSHDRPKVVSHSVSTSSLAPFKVELKSVDRNWVHHWSPQHSMSRDQIASLLNDRLRGYPRSMSVFLADHLLDLCIKYNFDPAFILSVIQAESGFRARVISSAQAIGLMQVQVPTAQFVARIFKYRYSGTGNELKDPFLNLSLGVAYLSYLRRMFRGKITHYLAAYNAGPGLVSKLLRRNQFKLLRKPRKYADSIQDGVPSFKDYGKTVVERPSISKKEG